MNKCIAVTPRLVKDEQSGEIREVLDMNWGKLFEAAGLLPVILPLLVNFKDYFKEFNMAGIVLTGGNDLSSMTKDPLSNMRDKRERELIDFAIKNDIPLLGVCRGMQIIAEFFGAQLAQTKGHVGTLHKLIVNKESLYREQLDICGEVNSFHNHLVNKIGVDLRISAWSQDRVIEAIEHRRYKIFGQMWHPEREIPFKQTSIDFINKYFLKDQQRITR